MQCKDIPDGPILEFIYGCRKLCFGAATIFRDFENSVTNAMPMLPEDGSQDKLAIAKMRGLVKRGLVNGCCCGCRGDFELTDEGIKLISNEKV